ncbi:antitoxin VbhA family protein [Williamsia sterculiae]|uniref:Antitoxin VbhA domain-containing protein n=1 Tax=Williamsia sterculiae TaxID=1344003 RepID=A0A1N7HEG6_9NOCA|nr:hypothetical protein [Williamsia sterculiae]SIS23153.1 hypothetical protein SAMN05445060_4066 [Williamsia sterculiae]
MTTTRHTPVTEQWPDLFTDLTAEQTASVTGAVANSVLEGWEPTRDNVAALCARATGDLDRATFRARARARAHARSQRRA